MDFISGPKVPFGYEARRVQHFPDFNLESFFIIKNIFVMKNPTDFGKTVETGVDPCLPNCPLSESPTASQCQVECWHVLVEVELFS